MGVTFGSIQRLEKIGCFPRSGLRILDIGSSNLYQASEKNIHEFVRKYSKKGPVEHSTLIQRLAVGSAYDPVQGGKNESFLGEMLELAGFEYESIDIAGGYKTTVIDLNYQAAPPSFLAAFDLVINFGTTEHLLNQFNAFQFIHDCTKPGGHIVHSVPCVGYTNHGYLTFTPRCLFDLAGYNDYEIVNFAYDDAHHLSDLRDPVRDYTTYFPALASAGGLREDVAKVPDICLFVVLKKKHDRPFLGALEKTTSVGSIPGAVTERYEIDAVSRNQPPASIQQRVGTGRIERFLRKFSGG